MSARTTQDRFPMKLRSRPDGRSVIGNGRVTVEAWIPTAAAFKFDRDDIQPRVPVPAPRLLIDLDSVYLTPVNNSHE